MNKPHRSGGAPSRLLAIYLQDHRAGAAAGFDLAQRILRENKGSACAEELASLVDAIASDRNRLIEIMGTLGVEPSQFKVLIARTGERIARLKPNGRVASYSPLSRLLELEALSLGIAGKRALWRSLGAVANIKDALGSIDLEDLLTRADRQLEVVERLRVAAAREAFVA